MNRLLGSGDERRASLLGGDDGSGGGSAGIAGGVGFISATAIERLASTAQRAIQNGPYGPGGGRDGDPPGFGGEQNQN